MPQATAHASLSDALGKLEVAAHKAPGLAYSGDITPKDAYQFLAQSPAILIDVRTPPEWQFTGLPDLSATSSRVLTLSWKTYPDFALNPQFVAQVSAQIPDKEAPLLFLCRTGGRSLDAAVAMTAAGYKHCFNIEGGFEGEPDQYSHRGSAQGWKAAQLPWKQN